MYLLSTDLEDHLGIKCCDKNTLTNVCLLVFSSPKPWLSSFVHSNSRTCKKCKNQNIILNVSEVNILFTGNSRVILIHIFYIYYVQLRVPIANAKRLSLHL